MVRENPLWQQGLTYPAQLDRQFIEDVFDVEGVIRPAAGGLLVSARAAGPNRSIDVAPGRAVIAGDDQALQGSYRILSTAVENLPIGADPGTNSRIDLVVARIRDAAVTGTASDWVLEVLPGPVASTPVAPAVPITAIALAQVLVVAGDLSVVGAKITDRRVAALNSAYTAKATPTLGYAQSVVSIGPSDFIADSALMAAAVTVPANRRIRVTAAASWATVNDGAGIAIRIKEGSTILQERARRLTNVLSEELACSVVLTPTAGAHVYTVSALRTDSDIGNKTLIASASAPAYLLVEDIGAAS